MSESLQDIPPAPLFSAYRFFVKSNLITLIENILYLEYKMHIIKYIMRHIFRKHVFFIIQINIFFLKFG